MEEREGLELEGRLDEGRPLGEGEGFWRGLRTGLSEESGFAKRILDLEEPRLVSALLLLGGGLLLRVALLPRG